MQHWQKLILFIYICDLEELVFLLNIIFSADLLNNDHPTI